MPLYQHHQHTYHYSTTINSSHYRGHRHARFARCVRAHRISQPSIIIVSAIWGISPRAWPGGCTWCRRLKLRTTPSPPYYVKCVVIGCPAWDTLPASESKRCLSHQTHSRSRPTGERGSLRRDVRDMLPWCCKLQGPGMTTKQFRYYQHSYLLTITRVYYSGASLHRTLQRFRVRTSDFPPPPPPPL